MTSVGSHGLSVSFRRVRAMSERRFRRTPEGCCRWARRGVVPKYRRRTGWAGGPAVERTAGADRRRARVADHGEGSDAGSTCTCWCGFGPTDAPAQVVRALFKGHTARLLRCEFPHLRSHRRCCGRRGTSRHRSVTSGVDGAPLHRAPVGRGDGVMRRAYVFGCARPHVSTSPWRRVGKPTASCTTPRCRSAVMRGRTARPASATGISRRTMRIRSVRPDVAVWSFSSSRPRCAA